MWFYVCVERLETSEKPFVLNWIFSVWFFFHENTRLTGQQWKGEGLYP